MEEILRYKSLDFSTADAECPKIIFQNGTELAVNFEDWQGQNIQIRFEDVLGFEWNQEELDNPEISDDCAYEVEHSTWIKKHISAGTIQEVSKYKHFKLCFNAWEF